MYHCCCTEEGKSNNYSSKVPCLLCQDFGHRSTPSEQRMQFNMTVTGMQQIFNAIPPETNMHAYYYSK